MAHTRSVLTSAISTASPQSIALARLTRLSSSHLADGCATCDVTIDGFTVSLEPADPSMRCSGRLFVAASVRGTHWLDSTIRSVASGDVVMVPFFIPELKCSDLKMLEEAGAGGLLMLSNKLPRFSPKIVRVPIFGLRKNRTYEGLAEFLALQTDTSNPSFLETSFVVADADGIILVPGSRIDEVTRAALLVREQKNKVFSAMCFGRSLRAQTGFPAFLRIKRTQPNYSFQKHLRLHGSNPILL